MSRTQNVLRLAPAACLAASVTLGAGCTLTTSSTAQNPTQSPASTPSSSNPSEWLAQAWEGWQRAQKAPPFKQSPAPRLALRAPSPLQTPLLERLDLSPRSFERTRIVEDSLLTPTRLPQPAFISSSGLGKVVLNDTGALWRRALLGFDTGSAGATAPARGPLTSTWSPLQEALEIRQVQALQSLALRVAQQRRAASSEREGLLRADLRDDLERVGRVDLDSLIPNLPPRERLEKLTNLRLKLLSALAIPVSTQEQAQSEIERIQNEIRALLREQEIERAELLSKLRREVPERLQSQREADIQRILQEAEKADSGAINALLSEQKRRVQVDFAAPAQLGLPALGATPSAADAANRERQNSFNKNQFRTFVNAVPSVGGIAPPVVGPQVLAARSAIAVQVPGDDAATSIGVRGGSSESARRWKALLLKRARAWRAAVR